MNSLSEYHFNEKTHSNEQPDKCKNCFSGLISGKAILRCNKSNFGTTNILLPTPPFVQTLNQPVASVTIDTSCLRCPNILISFDGILDISNLLNNFIQSTFTFTLFRDCKGHRIREAIATFNYNVIHFSPFFDINSKASHTLCFQHSSCDDSCDDCCTYILELSRISDFNPVTETISINGKLCALAVESPC